MGKLFLACPNRGDGATLTGGSWQTGLAPLQTRPLADVARSTNLLLTSTRFDIDHGQLRAVNFVGLVRHNFATAAKVRITAGNVAGGADLYDSGWLDAWPSVRPRETMTWYAPMWWDGRLPEEDRQGLSADYAHVLALPVLARYWRVEIDDQANAAGYVEIGRLFIADGWAPAINIDHGSSLGWEDKTQIDEADSGAEFFAKRPRRRVLRCRMSHMQTDEAMGRAFDLQRLLGTSGELYAIYDTDDTMHRMRRSFLGRLRQLSAIEHVSYDRHGVPFEIQEII